MEAKTYSLVRWNTGTITGEPALILTLEGMDMPIAALMSPEAALDLAKALEATAQQIKASRGQAN